MIKIIKEGIRKITTCDKCGCEFSYEHEDITKTQILANKLSIKYKLTINCPQCKSVITLSQIRKKGLN